MPTDDSPDHPRALLASLGLRPKKHFGQNFLMDSGAARRIARLALEGAAEGTPVVEIGAGTGALTHALLEERARVTAIEIDAQLIDVLRGREDLREAAIVQYDAMAYDFEGFSALGDWRVAANLPYNIGTPLLLKLIELERGPSSITVMIQKDVADRLAAKPGTPAYGSLSIAVQYAMKVERAFTLGPRAFYPPPKVNSTVVRLVRLERPAVQPRDLALFRSVVRAAFAYRRKTLANSLMLAMGLSRQQVAEAIDRAGLASDVRGEQLGLAQFCALADALAP